MKTRFLCTQDALLPSVAQVLNGTSYTSANTSVVSPVATGVVELPAAYTDGNMSVTGVNIASAYSVYLVGQDNNTSPNTMANVRRSVIACHAQEACCYLLH